MEQGMVASVVDTLNHNSAGVTTCALQGLTMLCTKERGSARLAALLQSEKAKLEAFKDRAATQDAHHSEVALLLGAMDVNSESAASSSKPATLAKEEEKKKATELSLIHISEPTRPEPS
eukprot:3678164-Pyramimonas_sp.AAC.1